MLPRTTRELIRLHRLEATLLPPYHNTFTRARKKRVFVSRRMRSRVVWRMEHDRNISIMVWSIARARTANFKSRNEIAIFFYRLIQK